MKVSHSVWMLAALVTTAASTVSAQSVTLPDTRGLAGSGVVVIGQVGPLGPPAIIGAPYSATRKTTRIQTLADGTTITHVTTEKEARDSQGRTYRETQLNPEGDGQQQPVIRYFVSDPVNRTSISWASNGQTVLLTHLPEPRQLPAAPKRKVQAPPATPPAVRFQNPNLTVVDLGTETIEGVEVRGTRTIRTIPEGQEGNDQPITITHESWVSPELRTTLQQFDIDPRFGRTTIEVTGIDRNEPDPRLFQAPEGYTVRELQHAQPGMETNP